MLQVLGIVIIVGASLFWAFTHQQSALIMGSGLALVGLGAYSGLRIDITTETRPPDLPDGSDPAVDVIEDVPE